MNRQHLSILIISLIIGFSSCNNDNDKLQEIDEEWKELNEKFFAQIALSGDYLELKSERNDGSIYYKVLQNGTGTERIYFGSKIEVYYQLYLIDNLEDPIQQVTREEGTTYSTTVTYESGLRAGWVTALQHMVVGDIWDIYIPHQLGYGRIGTTATTASPIPILPYSTLRFIIEVKDIVEQ